MKSFFKLLLIGVFMLTLTGCGEQCVRWETRTEDPCSGYHGGKYDEACEKIHGGKKTVQECVEWK